MEWAVGIVGAGAITRSVHLPALQCLPGARVAWVADAAESAALEAADGFGLRAASLATGIASLPACERPSNTVYVAAIVDALLRVAAGSIPGGTYDLMNVPQWTWRQVLVYEAAQAAVEPRIIAVGDTRPPGVITGTVTAAAGAAIALLATPKMRKLAVRLATSLPRRERSRLHARWAVSSCRADVARLRREPLSPAVAAGE